MSSVIRNVLLVSDGLDARFKAVHRARGSFVELKSGFQSGINNAALELADVSAATPLSRVFMILLTSAIFILYYSLDFQPQREQI